MKYVFFDIECADGGKGTICSVGYVMTDENFNEIFSWDMLINPQSKFNLTGRDGREDIKLAYSKEAFLSSPNFSKRYNEIKSLLEGDDITVIGYSVLNDMGFLVKSCIRYKLPGFNFKFYDVQKLYCDYFNIDKRAGLASAIESLELESSKCEHRSDEDARQTMLILKEICKRKNASFEECLKNCPGACGEIKGLHYYQGKAHYYKGQRDEDERIESLYPKEDKDIKSRPEKPGRENQILNGRMNHLMFLRFLEYAKPTEEINNKLLGKTVSISFNYEQSHFKEMIKLIQLIINAGGKYILKASTADLFVLNPEKTDRVCGRLVYVKKANSEGANVEIITFDQLLDILGTNKEEFDKIPTIDTEYLLDEKYKRQSSTEESNIKIDTQ